jgi:hypothetical protein
MNQEIPNPPCPACHLPSYEGILCDRSKGHMGKCSWELYADQEELTRLIGTISKVARKIEILQFTISEVNKLLIGTEK